MLHEPLRDLKNEELSPPFEPEDNDPERDLTSEICSRKPDAEPIEALKALARPLACEPASVRDPDRDLKSEVRSVRPEAEPIEVLKLTVRPLKKDVARPRESVNDLK